MEIEELENAVRESCFFCTDFTARLADISVGSPDGYSTVITRSKRGEELFGLLKDLETTSVDRDEIVKKYADDIEKLN